MSDISPHLLLPYIQAAQAQKHVTHNEAMRLLDAVVQLSVLDRDLTAPPSITRGWRPLHCRIRRDRPLGRVGSECRDLGRRGLDAARPSTRLAGLDRR